MPYSPGLCQAVSQLAFFYTIPTPSLHLPYLCIFYNFPDWQIAKGKHGRKAVYPRKGNTVGIEWAGSGLVPQKIKYYTLSIHTAAPKGAAVFLCSTHSPPFLFCYIQKPIILQKSAPRKKGLRSFAVRGRCRSPPLVLRFLKFGNEGGQAYGKGIQNPGL